jgi:hypothetical protein
MVFDFFLVADNCRMANIPHRSIRQRMQLFYLYLEVFGAAKTAHKRFRPCSISCWPRKTLPVKVTRTPSLVKALAYAAASFFT